MSGNKDFVIENGVLKKYTGSDSDVVIPEGVTVIGNYAFQGNYNNYKISLTINKVRLILI